MFAVYDHITNPSSPARWVSQWPTDNEKHKKKFKPTALLSVIHPPSFQLSQDESASSYSGIQDVAPDSLCRRLLLHHFPQHLLHPGKFMLSASVASCRRKILCSLETVKMRPLWLAAAFGHFQAGLQGHCVQDEQLVRQPAYPRLRQSACPLCLLTIGNCMKITLFKIQKAHCPLFYTENLFFIHF